MTYRTETVSIPFPSFPSEALNFLVDGVPFESTLSSTLLTFLTYPRTLGNRPGELDHCLYLSFCLPLSLLEDLDRRAALPVRHDTLARHTGSGVLLNHYWEAFTAPDAEPEISFEGARYSLGSTYAALTPADLVQLEVLFRHAGHQLTPPSSPARLARPLSLPPPSPPSSPPPLPPHPLPPRRLLTLGISVLGISIFGHSILVDG